MALTSPEVDSVTTKQPNAIFSASELTLYGGKFYSEERYKNNLLVTVSDKDKLSTLTGLLTAVQDSAIDYTKVDSSFTEQDPSYSVFVPANKTSDEGAVDEVIGVWFQKDEIWCVLEDADTQNSGSDTLKILYKAVGLQKDFVSDIKQLES